MNVYTSRLKVVVSHLGMKRIARFDSTRSNRNDCFPFSITRTNPFCITYIQNEHTRVCWFVRLFLKVRSTPTKTHQYSKLLSSRFLPFQSHCEDCSVGVMFWVRLLFFLSGFRLFTRANVLLRNPDFERNFRHFWESNGNNNVIVFCAACASATKAKKSMFTTTPPEWIDNKGNQQAFQ